MKFSIILDIVKKKSLKMHLIFHFAIRFAIIITILMKSNHNLIKNWDEKWKIKCILNIFNYGKFYSL